jgi:glycosyltransferase involved in cell wall biosynthesis
VKLLGMRTDVMQLLESADFFVMSSRWEGLPIALLEAGLAGLPVISTPAGSIPDLLEGGCGIVVASENLAAAMMDATRNPGDFCEMGQRLRQRIESKYSVSAMASAHLVFYADGAPAAAIPNRGDT